MAPLPSNSSGCDMGTPNDFGFDPQSFSGQARLFPVPNLVMFPHVLQPLHIFESRYREMAQDALDGDRLIAMAVLQPGWEAEYEGRPPLYPVACLGQIVNSQQLEDGRYHVLLQGLGRISLGEELEPPRAFRVAKAELRSDYCLPEGANRRRELKRELLEAVRHKVPEVVQRHTQVEEMLGAETALGILADLLGYSLPVPLSLKTRILCEFNIDRRIEILLAHLQREPDSAREGPDRFPPDFSQN